MCMPFAPEVGAARSAEPVGLRAHETPSSQRSSVGRIGAITAGNRPPQSLRSHLRCTNLVDSRQSGRECPDGPLQVDRLVAGEVGYFSASIKAVADARVGDTITTRKGGAGQVRH